MYSGSDGDKCWRTIKQGMNGAMIYWECCSVDRGKASVSRSYLSEDLREMRGQEVWNPGGLQQERAGVKIPRWK